MAKFIVSRLAYGTFAVLIATLLVFGLSRLRGDPRYMYLTGYATEERWEAWGKAYGLDRPLLVQYFVWLGKAFRGDFGESLMTGRPALSTILERVPATLELGLSSWLFALLTGVPGGVLSATRRGSIFDYVARTFALLGQALPAFWLGIMLILLFSVRLGWFPSGTRGDIRHYILPSITLGWLASAGFLRLTRSAMLEVLDSEFIKFARAKGVGEVVVILKHALRNAIIAPLTYAGLLLAAWLAGAVVTETVFSWPGVGRLAVNAVSQNDFPVLTGVVLLTTSGYVAVNALVDILYAYVDPRIRY